MMLQYMKPLIVMTGLCLMLFPACLDDEGETSVDQSYLSLEDVRFWAYQIQDISKTGAVAKLADSNYDMLVVEPTRTDWSSDDKYFDARGMVDRLKNTSAHDNQHSKLVVAYVDIGEAEDWRWYWYKQGWSREDNPGPDDPLPADWPDFILARDPDGWTGNYPVAYWDPRWKDIIIYGKNQDSAPYGDYSSVVDEVVKDGFDGIYLDWVEGYEFEAVQKKASADGVDPALEMIRFIEEIKSYARERKPGFLVIQQNAAALCDNHLELFDIVDAIAQEAVWYDGTGGDDWNDPNGCDYGNEESLTGYYLEYLDRFLENGVPVFNCEYACNYAQDAYKKSYSKSYAPYCTRRSLSNLSTTPPPGY